MNKGFTIIEIIVVIIIVGVLAALAWPRGTATREKSLDREARASLALIRAAERIYRMEVGSYYPVDGTTETNASTINTDLKLSLTEANWDYSVDNAASNGRARALRSGGGRTWTLDSSGSTEDAACSPLASCY